MSRYHGGKQRLGSLIADKIVETIKMNPDIQGYCEPFLGMAGVMEPVMNKMDKNTEQKHFQYLAGDINEAVIDMWNAVCLKKFSPPRICSFKQYSRLRSRKIKKGSSKDVDPEKDLLEHARKGFIGHACSFGGVYMKGYLGSYIKDNDSRRKSSRKKILQNKSINVSKQAKRVEKMGKTLCKAKLVAGTYEQFSDLKNYLIYCDPPYAEYNEYYDSDRNRIKFSSEEFWNWAEDMNRDNIVIVSGYSAPKKWSILWKHATKSGQMGSNRKRIEKLFILENT